MQDDLEEYLQIKVIRAGEEIVPTAEVDFGVDAEPFFGLKLSPMYEKMDTYFFGELVRVSLYSTFSKVWNFLLCRLNRSRNALGWHSRMIPVIQTCWIELN